MYHHFWRESYTKIKILHRHSAKLIIEGGIPEIILLQHLLSLPNTTRCSSRWGRHCRRGRDVMSSRIKVIMSQHYKREWMGAQGPLPTQIEMLESKSLKKTKMKENEIKLVIKAIGLRKDCEQSAHYDLNNTAAFWQILHPWLCIIKDWRTNPLSPRNKSENSR